MRTRKDIIKETEIHIETEGKLSSMKPHLAGPITKCQSTLISLGRQLKKLQKKSVQEFGVTDDFKHQVGGSRNLNCNTQYQESVM